MFDYNIIAFENFCDRLYIDDDYSSYSYEYDIATEAFDGLKRTLSSWCINASKWCNNKANDTLKKNSNHIKSTSSSMKKNGEYIKKNGEHVASVSSDIKKRGKKIDKILREILGDDEYEKMKNEDD